MDLIFLKPFMKEVVWGGEKIKNLFSYETTSKNIGEAWVVSANDNGYSIVKDGKYKGLTLKELYQKHKELFGKNSKNDVFPVLIKYIDASSDLSIQVHPDDEYAKKHENGQKGKAESWYVLDADEGSDIIVGHKAKTKEELISLVENKKWDELLDIRPVKKGDFFDIPTGTVHAIRKGTLIFEVQQNSDVTYRFYDYDRLQNGKLRELHLEKSFDVTTCPHKETINKSLDGALIETKFYKLYKLDIDGKEKYLQKEDFTIMCVIEGKGYINGIEIKKGDNFIIPNSFGEYEIEGKLCIMKVITP